MIENIEIDILLKGVKFSFKLSVEVIEGDYIEML